MIEIARRMFLSGLKICIKLTITTLFKLKLDKILSIFMGLIIILYNKNEINHDKKKIRILAVKKLIFNDDVKVLKKYPSNYKILFYPYPLKNSKIAIFKQDYEELRKYPYSYQYSHTINFNTINFLNLI